MSMLHQGIMATANPTTPWVPPLTNCIAAYDAEVWTSLNGGLNANTWPDLSNNGFHATQATAGSRPGITTSGGYPALSFDGVDDSFFASSIAASAGQKTIYAVVNPSGPTGSYKALFDTQSGRVLVGAYDADVIGFDTTNRTSGIAYAGGRQVLAFQVQNGAGGFVAWKNGIQGPLTPLTWGNLAAISGVSTIGRLYHTTLGYYQGMYHALGIYSGPYNAAVAAFYAARFGL